MVEPNEQNGPLTASIEKLRQELDRWRGIAMDKGGQAMNAFGIGGRGGFTPDVNLIETSEEILVSVDLPGVDPKVVEITLLGNMLTISGVKEVTNVREQDEAHLTERDHGGFTRSLPMPTQVNSEVVAATFRNGVLNIRLAKADRAKAQSIPVQVADE